MQISRLECCRRWCYSKRIQVTFGTWCYCFSPTIVESHDLQEGASHRRSYQLCWKICDRQIWGCIWWDIAIQLRQFAILCGACRYHNKKIYWLNGFWAAVTYPAVPIHQAAIPIWCIRRFKRNRLVLLCVYLELNAQVLIFTHVQNTQVQLLRALNLSVSWFLTTGHLGILQWVLAPLFAPLLDSAVWECLARANLSTMPTTHVLWIKCRQMVFMYKLVLQSLATVL